MNGDEDPIQAAAEAGIRERVRQYGAAYNAGDAAAVQCLAPPPAVPPK